jgi:hypothetical protein
MAKKVLPAALITALSISQLALINPAYSLDNDQGAASSSLDTNVGTNTVADTSTASDTNTSSGDSVSLPSTSGLKLPGADFIPQGDSVLKGSVSASTSRSPLLSGMVQSMPQGTKVDLTLVTNLNSELSQKGDEVLMRISHDVKSGDDGHVLVPGGWVAHGYVTDSVKPGRNGVAGHCEVKLDRLISPDGQTEVPFECKLSTGDKKIVAVSKLVAREVGYTAVGAAAGSVLSLQMTGIGVAVATHGISVGVGAAAGATWGIIGAWRKKGDIYSGYPGDELKLATAEPIELPGFNAANLPSAEPVKKIEGLRVRVQEFRFEKDALTGDKRSRILVVKFALTNNSNHSLSRRNLRVVSSKNIFFFPSIANAQVPFDVAPKSEKTTTMSFSVDSPKDKYCLVFVDDKGDEFNRVPIN